MSGLVVLAWSPRVAPGLLTARAWDLLRSADGVFAADGAQHPLAAALGEVGVEVRRAELDHLDRAASSVWLPAPEDTEADALAATGLPVVTGSFDVPGARLLELVAVMDRLRSPGGCAWDAEQTHTSLLTYLIEETYETVEAVELGDLVGLREELGDLLLQVVFHARIGEEHASDAWSIDDVARGITAKLVRRHPHVFGTGADGSGAAAGEAVTSAELDARWDVLKSAEKGRASAVDGVPFGQPALSLTAKLHDRAARAGVAPEPPHGPAQVPAAGPVDEAELGDLLLSVVVVARRAGLDPEAALRAAARRYAESIRALESGA